MEVARNKNYTQADLFELIPRLARQRKYLCQIFQRSHERGLIEFLFG